MGFGFSCALVTFWFPQFVGGGIFALLFPMVWRIVIIIVIVIIIIIITIITITTTTTITITIVIMGRILYVVYYHVECRATPTRGRGRGHHASICTEYAPCVLSGKENEPFHHAVDGSSGATIRRSGRFVGCEKLLTRRRRACPTGSMSCIQVSSRKLSVYIWRYTNSFFITSACSRISLY